MKLVRIEDHMSAFQRAHAAVVKVLGGTHRIATVPHPEQDLTQAWQDLYGIRVHRDRAWGNWEALEFPTEQAYMLWLMRWS